MAELTKDQQKAIALARARLQVQHGGAYVHPNDIVGAASAAPVHPPVDSLGMQGLALPGTTPPERAPPINANPPSRSFGMSSSDTPNPLPAIASLGDAMFRNVPVAGPYLGKMRDELNSKIYGGTPEQARADMEKTNAANPEMKAPGELIGKASPYLAAAAAGGLPAAAMGLEGSIGTRLLMGGLSDAALKTGDNMAHGEDPLTATGHAARDTATDLPFFALTGSDSVKSTTKAASTPAELEAAAKPLYDNAKGSGLIISQPFVKNFVDSVTSKVMSKGLDQTLTPRAVAAVKRLQDISGRNMSIQDAMTVREVLGSAAQKALDSTPKDRGLATTVLHDFDNFLEGVAQPGPQGQVHAGVLAGNAADAYKNLKDANLLWSKAQKGKMLDQAIATAVSKAASSDQSLEKTIRTEFGSIDREIIAGDLPGFSKDEIKTIRNVASGGGAERVARTVGKLRAGGIYGTMGAASTGGMIGHMMTGGDASGVGIGATLGGGGAALAGMIGKIGRSLAPGMAMRNAKYASAVARGPALKALGGPGPAPFAQQLPGIAGRAGTTMTLNEWSQQNAPQAQPAY